MASVLCVAGCVVLAAGVSAALAETTPARSSDPVKANSFLMVASFAFRPLLAANGSRHEHDTSHIDPNQNPPPYIKPAVGLK